MALGQVFLRALRFSPPNIIPPMFDTHLHLHVDLTRRTNGRILGTFQKQSYFGNRSALDTKIRTFPCILLTDFKTETEMKVPTTQTVSEGRTREGIRQ
jgi:hypothetical protein